MRLGDNKSPKTQINQIQYEDCKCASADLISQPQNSHVQTHQGDMYREY